ncbi:HNH endonuclease [Nonomuraea phyllanthi]|uniref:HNH endonuclease n=1 Tax=Nonomuraea phyllanthi TaxID=2219224 RepID=A0A5C4WCH5_9ACTN|nr:HNH endonuclease [Nonomuraea phyllanthi]
MDDETIAKLVAESFSVSEVLRKGGYQAAGGSHAWLSRRIKRLKLDTSHFEQRRALGGGPVNRKPPEEILVIMPPGSFRARTYQLRRALLESGMPHKCTRCGQGPEWMGEPLCLQVEHINGDRLDCRAENLCFLCPNCHTQTATYARSTDT